MVQDEDHAARLGRFALEAMQAALDTAVDEDGPDPDASVQIRVGLHCGPVSARCPTSSSLPGASSVPVLHALAPAAGSEPSLPRRQSGSV